MSGSIFFCIYDAPVAFWTWYLPTHCLFGYPKFQEDPSIIGVLPCLVGTSFSSLFSREIKGEGTRGRDVEKAVSNASLIPHILIIEKEHSENRGKWTEGRRGLGSSRQTSSWLTAWQSPLRYIMPTYIHLSKMLSSEPFRGLFLGILNISEVWRVFHQIRQALAH